VTEVYRLVKAERADDALSGEGARLYGGRWNPPGYPVVYASESRALAVLEVFVHLTLEARAMRFLLYQITLPRRARLKRHGEEFASNYPHLPASGQEAGRAWLDDGTELALVVPSVVVPQEANYVLNVRHTQFVRVRVAGLEPFSFDERLWRSRSARE
jgi:RES domain-containing protein